MAGCVPHFTGDQAVDTLFERIAESFREGSAAGNDRDFGNLRIQFAETEEIPFGNQFLVQHVMHLFDGHGPRQSSAEPDRFPGIFAERLNVFQVQHFGQQRIVSDCRMGIQREMRGIKGNGIGRQHGDPAGVQ